MENHGIVIRLEDDHAIVEISPPDGGCGRCHEVGGCGSNLLNESLRPKKSSLYRLPNTINAKPGDAVTVDLPEGSLLRAALLAYLFPTLLLILGAALGKAGSDNPLASLLGAGAGLLAALLMLHLFQKKSSHTHTNARPTLRPRQKDCRPTSCQTHTP